MAGLIALNAAAATAAMQQHEHGPAHASHDVNDGRLELNNGAKWKVDTALRTSMGDIQRAVAAYAANGASATGAMATQLAGTIDERIGYIVTNCKLDPKADAVLHVLIADMVKGAEWLRAPDHASHGLALVQKALEQYPHYFEA